MPFDTCKPRVANRPLPTPPPELVSVERADRNQNRAAYHQRPSPPPELASVER
jgi:hypothetical protein